MVYMQLAMDSGRFTFVLAVYVCLRAPCVRGLQLPSSAEKQSQNRSFSVPEGKELQWDDDSKPGWLMPEMTGAPPKGTNIAIVFRGEYLRSGVHCKPNLCSDYWMNKDNINENVVAPLKKAGANVRLFFHTYSYTDAADTELVKDLKPDGYRFGDFNGIPWGRDVYSYFEAMKAAMKDGWPDHLMLIRFDVSYRVPITSLDISWGPLNFCSPGGGHYWTDLHKVNDLFFIIPKKYVDHFAAALKVTAGYPPELGLDPPSSVVEREEENEREDNDGCEQIKDWEQDDKFSDDIVVDVPHMVYPTLLKLIGKKNMYFISEKGYTATANDFFLYLNRECGPHVNKEIQKR